MKRNMLYLTIALITISCQNQSIQLVTEEIAEVNGTELYYEIAGSGETLVLVHGNCGDRRHWDFQFLPLAKEFNVIRYDVRGYGKSALPDPEETYSDYEDLKALLDYLKINKVHLCGLSMGSGIIVDFAIAYPEMCKSLIPISPWVSGYGMNEFKSPSVDSLSTVMTTMASIAREKGSKEATDYLLTGNLLIENSIRSVKTLDLMKMAGYDYSFWGFINESKRQSLQPMAISQLGGIKTPTLIVTAEYDFELSKELAEIMEKEIAGAKKVSIEKAGHCMNMDRPGEFKKILIKFIRNLN